jgi:hypothetical protein
MRTFWDQRAALVDQADRPRAGRQAPEAESGTAAPQVAARSVALKGQIEDIGRALDRLERLKGLFQGFLSPIAELVLEFQTCRDRMEETTARLVDLEEARRDLAGRHAAAREDRDRLAGRAAALDEAQLDLGDGPNPRPGRRDPAPLPFGGARA